MCGKEREREWEKKDQNMPDSMVDTHGREIFYDFSKAEQ